MESPLLEKDGEENDDTTEFATQGVEQEPQPDVPINNATTRKGCGSPTILICISHALSAWGDRMWAFALSIFLIGLTPVSFRLVAILGMAVSLSVVAFGPLVGDWIDATPRLKAARLTLIIQNVAVVVCAMVLLIMVTIGNKLFYFLAFVLVLLAIVARLASVGTTIAIERDWVVVIAKDAALLAGTNANLRRIDLTCNILAPIITGIVLYAGSTIIGILFVAGWNVISLFAEYFLLSAVYAACPELAIKTVDQNRHGDINTDDQEDFSSLDLDETPGSDGTILVPRVKNARSFRNTIDFLIGKVKTRIRTLRFGFKLYFQQRIALAGLGLASLYLTVLGFDSITTAYAYSQHLSPAILGALTAAGALTGIIGTFIFPQSRKLFGLVKTGVISMSVQLFFLMFCVASVWAPGHPGHLLDPFYHHHHESTPSTQATATPVTTMVYKTNEGPSITHTSLQPTPSIVRSSQYRAGSSMSLYTQIRSSSLPTKNSVNINPTSVAFVSTSLNSYNVNATMNVNNASGNTSPTVSPTDTRPSSFVSLGLLMGGLVMSRIGLWMTDLVITQLFQENIAEKERGIVGGVQNSFNNVMDVAHFILVTVAPKPEQFGALILVSVCMVALGFACYVRFAWKFRKRLAQLEKLSEWSNSKESLEGSSSRLRKENQSNSQENMMTGTLTVENENYSM